MTSMTTNRDRGTGSGSKGPETRLPADPASEGALPAQVGAPARRASIFLVAGFGLLVACLFLFGTVAEGIRDNEVFVLDTVATPVLHNLASPGLDLVMNDATTIGSIAVIPILFALAIIVPSGDGSVRRCSSRSRAAGRCC
jgi:hypothetical protein